MKTIPLLILTTVLLMKPAAQAQTDRPAPLATTTTFQERIAKVVQDNAKGAAPGSPVETPAVFSINFPGGTPQQLVDAINKQAGIHVNALIPDESAGYSLPAFKMNSVTLVDLFAGIERMSRKMVRVVTGSSLGMGGRTQQQFQYQTETAGFSNVGNVWFFKWERPQLLAEGKPKVCRYYQLGPYLTGRKVEDITTAIQTGWKMLGETKPPELKFHPETAMLIAVGAEEQLTVIDNVLEQLRIDSIPLSSTRGGRGARPQPSPARIGQPGIAEPE